MLDFSRGRGYTGVMPTETMINETINTLGMSAFLEALNWIGWRGIDEDNPQQWLVDYIDNHDEETRREAEQMVRNDMIYSLLLCNFTVPDNYTANVAAQ